MVKYTVKQGDNGRVIRAQLQDDAGFVDLTDAGPYGEAVSVEFKLRMRGSSFIDYGAADIEDAENGIVAYVLQDGQTDVPGYFLGEFQVTFNDGAKITFPSGSYVDLYIVEALF